MRICGEPLVALPLCSRGATLESLLHPVVRGRSSFCGQQLCTGEFLIAPESARLDRNRCRRVWGSHRVRVSDLLDGMLPTDIVAQH